MRGVDDGRVRDDPGAGEAAPAEGRAGRRRGRRTATTWRARATPRSSRRSKPPFRKLWTVRSGSLLEFPPVVGRRRVFVEPAARPRLRDQRADRATCSGAITYKRCARRRRPSPGQRRLRDADAAAPVPARAANAARRRCSSSTRSTGKELWQFNGVGARSSRRRCSSATSSTSARGTRASTRSTSRTHKVRWTFETDGELQQLGGVRDREGVRRQQRRHSLRDRREDRRRTVARPLRGRLPPEPRVLLRDADGRIRARLRGQHRRQRVRVRRHHREPPLGATCRHLRLHGARRLGPEGLRGTYDGRFLALDAATGDTVWSFDAPASIHGAPTVMNGIVYFATCGTCGTHGIRSAKLGPRMTIALNARTGKQLWTFRDGQILAGRCGLEAPSTSLGAPAVYGLGAAARSDRRPDVRCTLASTQRRPRRRSAARRGTRSGRRGRGRSAGRSRSRRRPRRARASGRAAAPRRAPPSPAATRAATSGKNGYAPLRSSSTCRLSRIAERP